MSKHKIFHIEFLIMNQKLAKCVEFTIKLFHFNVTISIKNSNDYIFNQKKSRLREKNVNSKKNFEKSTTKKKS